MTTPAPTTARRDPGRSASAAGAHAELLAVTVVRRQIVARDTAALWLARPGDPERAPAPYLPGQFVTLAFPTTARDTLYRSYSLAGDGDPAAPWEIAVKRSGAVSAYLFDHIRPGATLYATPPRGQFVLPAQLAPGAPLVFVAAGSGIAPIYGMLRALARLPEPRRPRVQLHYASADPESVIYARQLLALDPDATWLRQYHYLASRGERLTPEILLAAAGSLVRAAHWYVCGPDDLKSGVQEALARAGLPPEQFHAEVFGDERAPAPYSTIQTTSIGPVAAHLRLADTDTRLDVRAGETVLAALERHGYRPDASCRTGECGVCRLRLLAGRVDDPGPDLTPDERAAGYVLACVARPAGDLTLASAGGRGASSGDGSPRTRRRTAVVALRVGLAAASVALFGGALRLTSHGAATSPAATVPVGPTTGGQSGPSGPGGFTTSPIHIGVPDTHTGVS